MGSRPRLFCVDYGCANPHPDANPGFAEVKTGWRECMVVAVAYDAVLSVAHLLNAFRKRLSTSNKPDHC